VKVSVWCALSAGRIIGPVFFKEAINCEGYVWVILGQFLPKLPEEERFYSWFQTQLLPTLHVHVYLCRFCSVSSGRELLAVVFGQPLHPIIILVIISSGVVWGAKFISATPERAKKIFLGKLQIFL
jgi:hypothetical protein